MASGEFNHWQQVIDEIVPACKRVVSKTARAGKAHEQEHIEANGQVKTGYMRDSAYASTPEGSDYSGGPRSFPEETPPDETSAIFGVAADYGPYQNYGTRYLPPRAFHEPAIEDTQRDFVAALEEAVHQLEQVGAGV